MPGSHLDSNLNLGGRAGKSSATNLKPGHKPQTWLVAAFQTPQQTPRTTPMSSLFCRHTVSVFASGALVSVVPLHRFAAGGTGAGRGGTTGEDFFRFPNRGRNACGSVFLLEHVGTSLNYTPKRNCEMFHILPHVSDRAMNICGILFLTTPY